MAASCSCVPPSACCTIIASSASTFGQPGHTGHTGYWGRGEEPWRWSLSCKPRQHQTRPPIVIRRLKWPLSVATVSRENNKRMQHGCNSHFWWLHLSRCLSLSTCDLCPGRHQARGVSVCPINSRQQSRFGKNNGCVECWVLVVACWWSSVVWWPCVSTGNTAARTLTLLTPSA